MRLKSAPVSKITRLGVVDEGEAGAVQGESGRRWMNINDKKMLGRLLLPSITPVGPRYTWWRGFGSLIDTSFSL
jgi:hypothetical protein